MNKLKIHEESIIMLIILIFQINACNIYVFDDDYFKLTTFDKFIF